MKTTTTTGVFMSNVIITIATWYDTITPESATEGDYESTGNEYRSIDYDNLRDAADDYVAKLQQQYWDNHGFQHVNEVNHATDPDTDYRTGAQDYDRLVINVRSNGSIRTDREKRIVKALNYLIEKKLNA
jgi:hypothetical protein